MTKLSFTQLQFARKGIITEEMRYIADKEGVDIEELVSNIKAGRTIILKNNRKDIKPVGIGKGLCTKVNANIGVSPDASTLEEELKKLEIAIKYGADAVMDLSIGKDVREIRREIILHSTVPVGTVPIYEVADNKLREGKGIEDITVDDFLSVLEEQARAGVDFMTIHAGVTRRGVELSKHRLMGIVSRGGSIIEEWMIKNNKENFLLEHFDEILDILREYDVVISLGDGLRPGATYDANDQAQIEEMIVLGELTLRAWEKGVQVIIEEPGHMPLDTIEANIRLQKKLCYEAPYYVLGPLVVDIAPGYDHIVSAIGGAIASMYGADFLCYVTPAEHLSLPDVDDVREGVIAAKIAAHAGDMIKLPKTREWDNKMSKYRKELNWEEQFRLAIDEEKARKKRNSLPPSELDFCSMCGNFCAVKRDSSSLKKEKREWYL
jgi:phosphomethylpyrimidine synthase